MKKSSIKLYNILFPIWLLWLFPGILFFVLAANFVIDLLVVALAMKCLKIPNWKQNAKTVICRVWIMGFAADFIGTLAMLSAILLDNVLGDWWYGNIVSAISFNPFESIFSVLWVAACVLLAAFFIYFFNDKWCLKKLAVTDMQRKRIALSLAVLTAPYLFYLPSEWFYRAAAK